MTLRTVLTDFGLANPYYTAASVSVWQVDAAMGKTATLATLYANPSGATTLANPQTLDSQGRFAQPVYIDAPAIMTVDQGGEETDTGVVGLVTRWRGQWATSTIYYVGERLQKPGTVDSYIVLVSHTSTVFATDVALGRLELEITGIGDAVARGNYATAGQVQDSVLLWGGTSAGSADDQTIALDIAIPAYAEGQRFAFIPGFTNTGPATLAVSGLAEMPIVLADGSTALIAGSLTAGELTEVVYDGTSFRLRTTVHKLPLGSRNKIINGNFAVNQRAKSGTVTLAAGVYGHDRWKAGSSGCTYTFTTSGLDTTIAITAGWLEQVIEGNNVEGGDYTLTWTGTAQGKIGSGSYGNSGVTASGVTAAANLTIAIAAGTVTRIQLEADGATPFERRVYADELALCRRYYATYYHTAYVPVTTGSATNISYATHPVEMRAAPTATGTSSFTSNVSSFTVNAFATAFRSVLLSGGVASTGEWTGTLFFEAEL